MKAHVRLTYDRHDSRDSVTKFFQEVEEMFHARMSEGTTTIDYMEVVIATTEETIGRGDDDLFEDVDDDE